jgi:ATP-dependent Clp protease ATP-binding subunit ClpC
MAVTNKPPLSALGVGASEAEEDRLTPRARRLWAGAVTVAREFGHEFVGTEHLLLAMIREADGIAGRVLEEVLGT